jgi:molecular chaperone DnaK
VEKIKDSTEALVNASHTFTQRLYEQASQAGDPTSAAGGAPSGDNGSVPSDDEVVDAEIVDEPGA